MLWHRVQKLLLGIKNMNKVISVLHILPTKLPTPRHDCQDLSRPVPTSFSFTGFSLF